MIYDHFNLTINPFSETPPLDAIKIDGRFTPILRAFEMIPHIGTIATLTGRTGTGKTTLLRHLVQNWDRSCDVCYLHLGNLKGAGLFRALLHTIGEAPRLGKDRMFQQFYAHLAKKRRPLCVFLDEAHLIDIPSMTDLRVLCSHVDIPDALILLLCGQPDLKRTLNSETLTDLRERIALSTHLSAMTAPETHAYIAHLLRYAGAKEEPIFHEDAITLIHHAAEGVPRLINRIAKLAMMNAYQNKSTHIDEAIAQAACRAERS